MTHHDREVVFAGANDCRISDYTVPRQLAADEVVVRNQASLVSPGTELAVLRKRHRAFESGGEAAKRFSYPFRPGYAAVGRVERLGAGVTDVKMGDLVWHASPHATASVVKAAACVAVPEGTGAANATFFSLVKIALTAIRRCPAQLGDRVLVSGLGLVGILVSRLYVLSGATVTAADFAEGRLTKARSLGASQTLNLSEQSLVEWYESGSITAPDITIEAAGIESNIAACLRVTRPGGTVVLQGSPRKPMEIDPYTDIHRPGLTVIGAHMNTVSEETRRRDMSLTFDLINDRIDIPLLRTHTFALADLPQIYDRLEDSLDEYLGVVLDYEL